jgi:magnesium-transporting ATPase (P-type)
MLPNRKMNSTVMTVSGESKIRVYIKGAPFEVINCCTKALILNKEIELTNDAKENLMFAVIPTMAYEGCLNLMMAYKDFTI